MRELAERNGGYRKESGEKGSNRRARVNEYSVVAIDASRDRNVDVRLRFSSFRMSRERESE